MEQSAMHGVRSRARRPIPFFYARDDYALRLLRYAAGSGSSVRALRAGRFGRLLDKPRVRELLACAGDARVDASSFVTWSRDKLAFRLTLGEWGSADRWRPSYHQTSRPGGNVVLQLNFTSQHDRPFHRLVRPRASDPAVFNYCGHPVSQEHITLAWARLDIDVRRREALIEEVQCDWVRCALASTRRPWRRSVYSDERRLMYGWVDPRTTVRDVQRYIEHVLWPYRRVWTEAMLSAAIAFSYEVLGIERVWYHTFDGGNRLKDLRGPGCPPRHVYSSLPKRFCFERTTRGPSFLEKSEDRCVRVRVVGQPIEWFLLELPRRAAPYHGVRGILA